MSRISLLVMGTKCVMNRCATMQSALLQYLQSECHCSILSMIMMQMKVSFVFLYSLITKIYGLVKKIKTPYQLLRKL